LTPPAPTGGCRRGLHHGELDLLPAGDLDELERSCLAAYVHPNGASQRDAVIGVPTRALEDPDRSGSGTSAPSTTQAAPA